VRGSLITKISKTDEDFYKHLKQQIRYLKNSCELYDNGDKEEAYRLATTIRVLVYDNPKGGSISLLTHLGKKDISFYDSAYNFTPGMIGSFWGITGILLDTSKGASFEAPLNNRYGAGKNIFGDQSVDRIGIDNLIFEDWWNKIIFVDDKGNRFSRKDIILNAANKDGGAHVDAKLDEAYANLTRKNSLGLISIHNGVKSPLYNPELSAIRQIAFELMETLKKDFSVYFK
jgi:hypothetical protein